MSLKKKLRLKSASSILFTYSTKSLVGSAKVRFLYALKGRGDKVGILKRTKSQFLARGVILAPHTADDILQDFFKLWNVSYNRRVLNFASPVSYLSTKVRSFCNKYRQVSDCILIHIPPSWGLDISGEVICIISSSSKPNEIISALVQRVRGYPVIHFKSNQLFKPENKPWLDLFSKGVSLLHDFTATHTLFLYSTRDLTNNERVKLYYELKGRNGKSGLLARTKSEFLAKTVLLVPILESSKIAQALARWRCKFVRYEVRLLNE